LTISPGIKIPLLAKKNPKCTSVVGCKTTRICNGSFKRAYQRIFKIFEPLSPGEVVNTSVRAEIRTSTSDPIYTMSYPYPTNMRGEVDRQIEELLRDGIIKPPKNPKPNGEKQYRMVLDFKRLNAVTIADT